MHAPKDISTVQNLVSFFPLLGITEGYAEPSQTQKIPLQEQ